MVGFLKYLQSLSQSDSATQEDYHISHVYPFRCPGCGKIYVADDMCHELLIDPSDVTRKQDFIRACAQRCPSCSALWYPRVDDSRRRGRIALALWQEFPFFFHSLVVHEWLTEGVSLDEIRESEWRWLLDDSESVQ